MKLKVLICVLCMAHPFTVVADRGFIADRPGAIDSPKTMEDGTFRLETGVFSSEAQRGRGVDDTAQTFGSFFAVGGIGERMELQIGVDGFKFIDQGGVSDDQFGASRMRLKYNFFGNDNEQIAAAVIPKIIYTGPLGGHQVNMGINIPVTFSLPYQLSLAVMPEWNYEKKVGSDRESQYGFSLSLGRSFSDRFSGYIYNTLYTDDYQKSSSLQGIGGAYQLNSRIQFDLGFDYGKNYGVETTKWSCGVVYAF